MVDYKGIRYVAQSIIPGIFNQGENCAQLCYGVLEPNKNLTVSLVSIILLYEFPARPQIVSIYVFDMYRSKGKE